MDHTTKSGGDESYGGRIMQKTFYTYMMASGKHGTIYIGMTSDLVKRVWQHKNHVTDGFTDQHDVTRLVWYEQHSTAENAIIHEKRLKKYKRDWKANLIEQGNPHWTDLYPAISG